MQHWNGMIPFEARHEKTNNVAVRSAKTQISLGIRPVWSESSLSTWRKLGSLATHWMHSKDSDQTWRMPRLIRPTGRMPRLIRPGWSESSLGAYSFCWFCHVVAHFNLSPLSCFLLFLLGVYGPSQLFNFFWAGGAKMEEHYGNVSVFVR